MTAVAALTFCLVWHINPPGKVLVPAPESVQQKTKIKFSVVVGGRPVKWACKPISYTPLNKHVERAVKQLAKLTGHTFRANSNPSIRIRVGTPETHGAVGETQNWYQGDTFTDSVVTLTPEAPYTAVLHELAHALGLSHSDGPPSVMSRYLTTLETFHPAEKRALKRLGCH